VSDVQRSDEWFKARHGCVGASRVGDIMAKTKSGPSASRKNYLAEILCARLTGESPPSFESEAMRWGTETEPLARSRYEIETENTVIETGFQIHPNIPTFGASPDGLVNDDGGLEIKCPNTATHIDTLLNGTVALHYVYQMQTGMACTGRKWWDFVSYDPRLPYELQIKIIRFQRDDAMIKLIESEVVAFLAELDDMVAKLRAIA
jgi:putative phage-type endonuclease